MSSIVKLKDYLLVNKVEVGCDEAGRGCLAGPVYAAAVILPPKFECEGLNDSKKLTEKKRFQLREIIERNAVAYAIGVCSPEEIDEHNILWASVLAMHKAIEKLPIIPEHILVDGNRFRAYNDIPYTCVVGGDGHYKSIAAASILAKTYRDEYMAKIDFEHPEYEWKTNKGYPTKGHRKAILKYGVTKYHRSSFNLIDKQMSLSF